MIRKRLDKKNFVTFAKINDRAFKVVKKDPFERMKKKIERDLKPKDTFYNEEALEKLRDNDSISSRELGFMIGYIES
ncbi:MAG: hypothetical protein U9R08_03680 [Nanoarchaeota archaeon]|nr:hypothetical protein [Nanoarchaeota archaeon]